MIKYLPRAFTKRLFVFYGLMSRAMTMGVRAIVLDNNERLLLVKHTYVNGWHLPGGGVERSETLIEAVIKEVREEASIQVSGRPVLFHVYRNPHASRFDHVALFICKEWKKGTTWQPDQEIAEIGFFNLDNLPSDTTPATRRRISEVFNGNLPADVW